MQRKRLTKVIIQRGDGRCLMLTGTEWLERPDRSFKPDLPGGNAHDDESFEQCAIRETLEETGITLLESQLVPVHAGTIEHKDDKVNISALRLMYLATLEGEPEVTLSWEHSEFEWVSFDELTGREWRPYFVDAFEFIKRSGVLS